MRRDEAQQLFLEASQLYQEGQFAAAIEILEQLNRVFPNNEGVLLSQAHCLAHLFRTVEAIKLCDRIVARHKSAKALELKNYLIKNDGIPSFPNMDEDMPMPALGIVLETPHWLHRSVTPQGTGRRRWLWYLLGVMVLAVAVALALYFLQ